MDPREPLVIGQTLSGFEILELAGSGGMGQVYRARDLRLRRRVAVKILHPDKAVDKRRRRRFLREARAYSALNHPGVVSIHMIGRGSISQESTGQDHEMDFIVMEWVDGQTLADHLEKGGLPIERIVDLSGQLAEALTAVHDAGIIHRDLKPHNVMVRENGRVVVIDFGIAALEADPDVDTISRTPTELTRDGLTPGTLAYMSPEQALGEEIDQRSDIFAFGTLLYEMISGSKPFIADSVPALVRQLAFAEPQSLTEIRRDLPEGLQDIVSRALAKNVDDRYPDMAAMAEDLRKLPTGAPPTTATSSVVTSGKSGRWRLTLPVLLCAVLGFILYSTIWTKTPSSDDSEARGRVASRVVLPQTPYELYEEGMRHLERYDREGYIDAAIERFETALEQDLDYAPAHLGLARAFWRQFRSKRDPAWLQYATQSVKKALEIDPLLSNAGVTQARIKIMQGSLEEAREELEALQTIDPGNAEVVAGLAEVTLHEGDAATAAELFTEASILEPRSWEFHAERGRAFAAAGELEQAVSAFRKSLGVVPDNAFARRNLGALLHFLGRYGEAVVELQQSITIRPTDRAYSNLGTAYFFQGAYREAATAFEAARELGANNYRLWSNLGDAYRQIPGRAEDALVCFQRAIQLLREDIDASRSSPTKQSRLALFLAKAGEPEQAKRELEKATPLAPQEPDIAYRATIVRELAGQRSSALRSLAIALEGGYPPVEIRNDPELIELREDVAFHELMVRFDTTSNN